MKTYYDLLNLPKNADKRDIKHAFYKLAKQLHPDISKSADRFLEVLRAYETLIDDRKREEYDQRLTASGPGLLPRNRVSFAISLRDVAGTWRPRSRSRRRNPGLYNPKGYHVCVHITRRELEGGSAAPIDVPAHVICPLCRGDRISCELCGSKGYILKAVTVPVRIPGDLSDGDIFSVSMRKMKNRCFAYFMVDRLFVKIQIFR